MRHARGGYPVERVKKIGEGKIVINVGDRPSECERACIRRGECFLRGRPPGRPFSLRTPGWCESSSQGRCTCGRKSLIARASGIEENCGRNCAASTMFRVLLIVWKLLSVFFILDKFYSEFYIVREHVCSINNG